MLRPLLTRFLIHPPFFCHWGPHLESHFLLRVIIPSRVLVSISDTSWEESLFRGVLQGSSYSAELFSRTVMFFIGSLVPVGQLLSPLGFNPLTLMPPWRFSFTL